MASDRAESVSELRAALRVADGPVTLLGYDTAARPGAPRGRDRTARALEADALELGRQQEMLYANGVTGDRRRLLLVLQGMDTAGKDGAIRHVLGAAGPAGIRVTSFKKPTPEEGAHHFLWRIRRALPAAGVLGVFNRSHYEDVVVGRVHASMGEDVWTSRISDILAFERELLAGGTAIVKCFLHMSYTEQRSRLLARLDDPGKLWKFNPRDIDERPYWSDYQAAYAAAIARTSTDEAPWYIVPSDSKLYRNWAVGRLLLGAFADLRLSFPTPDFDVEECRHRLQPPF